MKCPKCDFKNYFSKNEESSTYVAVVPEEDDFDKIENGIHVRTGLKDAEGLMTVVNNCTNGDRGVQSTYAIIVFSLKQKDQIHLRRTWHAIHY